jgi:2-polyprenyl-3-methyl-5-hydroxy-6-metoxy-1,4-benzoquinol methylase
MFLKSSDLDFKKYLTGEKFHPNLSIKFDLELKVKNREKFLSEIVKNKKVVHVGCIDHLDILEQKISNGTWLHNILVSSASKCIGVDINKEGVDYLAKHLNIQNIIYGNLEKEIIEEIANEKWDYILLPEVVEHIPNIVSFLSSIRENYRNNFEKIIITVPNLFSYSLFHDASKNVEKINTDHRFWFSPYTLLKILNDANFQIEELHLVNGFWGPIYCNSWERAKNRLLHLFGMEPEFKKISDMRYAKGLLAIAR